MRQNCLIEYTYDKYNNNFDNSLIIVESINSNNLKFIPKTYLDKFNNSLNGVFISMELLKEIKNSEKNFNKFSENYKPLHMEVRSIERKIIKLVKRIEKIKRKLD